MILRKLLIFWIFFTLLNTIKCQEVPEEFVRRNDLFYIPQTNNEIPKSMKEYLKLNNTDLIITGSSKNDTSVLISTLREHEVKWIFCRDESLRCANKEQEFSVCYHNADIFESNSNIDKECDGPRMCKIKVKLSSEENFIFSQGYSENGNRFTTQHSCYFIHLFASNQESQGHINILDGINGVSEGVSSKACKIRTTKLPKTKSTDTFHTQIIVQQGENNDGCNIKMKSYLSSLIIKGQLIVSNSTVKPKHPITSATNEESATAKFFDDWKYLIIVIVVIIIIAIVAAIIIKRKWLKKQFQKKKKVVNPAAQIRPSERPETNGTAAGFDETTPYASNRQKNATEKVVVPQNEKKENGQMPKDSKPPGTTATVEMKPLQIHPTPTKNANPATPSLILQPSSTQPSLSCDKTPPKTEAEMTPDELEYLAFSTPDTGKRYRIFRTAVKLAEKIAESHGFWINDRDPTVPGDEEDWLKNHADSLTKTCVEIHGVPVPDIGATHNEHLEYIDKHSVRDIYIIALYAEVEEPTRMFFLSSVIERFREVIKQIPTTELAKAPHPLPLLLRVYDEHPEVFGVRPPRGKNNEKLKNDNKNNTNNKKK